LHAPTACCFFCHPLVLLGFEKIYNHHLGNRQL
jgi:hypothetical protein